MNNFIKTVFLSLAFSTTIQCQTANETVKTTATKGGQNTNMVTNRTFTVLNFDKVSKVKKSLKDKEKTHQKPYESLIKLADKSMTEGLTSVMQKTQTPPSGDKHDYLSLAPYFWPDPAKADGLPWIRKDGQVNPLTRGKNVDEPSKDVMLQNAKNLAYAYYFSEDVKYAKRSIEVLKTWFLNPETKMNPNLNFGQGIPGVNTGRGFGMIEFTGILDIITALEMLRQGKALDAETDKGMVLWLTEYVNWMQTSKIGLQEKATTNNHGTWYDAQLIGILSFLKRDDEAKVVLENFKKRIEHQIAADGKQPEELARTKSLSYSIMNLKGITQIAYVGKNLGVDLWNYTAANGANIQKAYDFLQPYAEGTQKWDLPQLGNLDNEIDKLRHLFLFAGSAMDKKAYYTFQSKVNGSSMMDNLLYPCF